MCLIKLIDSKVGHTPTITIRRVRVKGTSQNFTLTIRGKNSRNNWTHIVWLNIPKEYLHCAFYSNPQTLIKSRMESFNSFDYIAVSKGSIDFWDINLTFCASRTYMYVLAVPCAQPLHIHYVLSLFHQQPLELSLGNEGRIYTSKIVNFSNHKKYTRYIGKVTPK